MSKIGILGGGQLSQMLLREGLKAGLDVRAYCQQEIDPAYALGKDNKLGSTDDPIQLQSFLDSIDICTFESEFIDCNKLSELNGFQKKFSPSVKVMSELQDRKSQKELLELYKISTLPFFHSDQADWVAKVADELSHKVVFKERRNSYDGYGTYICKTKKDLENFLDKKQNQLDQFILEPLFKFKRELAISAFRSKDGSKGLLPLVEWKAKDSKCHWVMGPVKSKHLQKLESRILSFLERIDYIGIMAFEFFESKNGVFVNEIAPRVHNSAHYSLDAMGLNQFIVHLKCLLGEKLPRQIKAHTGGFAMVNLIGTGASQSKINTDNQSMLYWYSKNENKKGRKLGHINAVAKNPKLALKNALKGARLCQV